jgi:hypothetical protein
MIAGKSMRGPRAVTILALWLLLCLCRGRCGSKAHLPVCSSSFRTFSRAASISALLSDVPCCGECDCWTALAPLGVARYVASLPRSASGEQKLAGSRPGRPHLGYLCSSPCFDRFRRGPEVFLGPSVFGEAWGAKPKNTHVQEHICFLALPHSAARPTQPLFS